MQTDTTNKKMNRDDEWTCAGVSCLRRMPYLRAIQDVPGDTPHEKMRWIGKLAAQQQQAGGDPEQLVPRELLPLLYVEAAIRKNRLHNHEDIRSALESDDALLISRALKASWFFDGSHKEILNVAYFCEHILSRVSLNTRARVVNSLAHYLNGKDPAFAQELFTAVESTYDVRIAYPLIVACNEHFAYKTIAEKQLVLPHGIMKKIYRANPNLAVRYLKLLKPCQHLSDELQPDLFAIGLDSYKHILIKLVKKRFQDFIELCEAHEAYLPRFVLSYSCADIFLKKGRQYLLAKPQLYTKIIPLKKINAELMEKIFPKLLPDFHFGTDVALSYLEYYPQDKVYPLLVKSYKDKYGKELLDDPLNVTPRLMRLLPAEERIKQAKIKIKNESLRNTDKYEDMPRDNRPYFICMMNYETSWICYLSTKEAIPILKDKIGKTANYTTRMEYIVQMIYNCKVNKDEEELRQILIYITERHKNENSWVLERILEAINNQYDLTKLSFQTNMYVFEIIKLFYVKNGFVDPRILESMIHFYLINKSSITELIEMLVTTSTVRGTVVFNILKDHPEYEKECLVTSADIVQKKYFTDWRRPESQDLDEQKQISSRQNCLTNLILAMYTFNNRCKEARVKIEPLSIKNYPQLVEGLRTILQTDKSSYYRMRLQNILKQSELELYRNLTCDEDVKSKLTEVTSIEAIHLLNRNPQSILDNWEEYLAQCRKYYKHPYTIRFIRATRWHKSIPIKFAERCLKDLDGMDTDKQSALIVLSLLFHGDSLKKVIEPLIPANTELQLHEPDARKNYMITETLPRSMRLCNPPMSLEVIGRLCQGDYLSLALTTLRSVSRRTVLAKVKSFALTLLGKRVSVRKHGIRLMRLIISTSEFISFLEQSWKTEKNHSIREVLFDEIQNLFFAIPCLATWSLYHNVVSLLTVKDYGLLISKMELSHNMQRCCIVVASDGIGKYLELWFAVIKRFRAQGLDEKKTNGSIFQFLNLLSASVSKFVPEELAEKLIESYLFHKDIDVATAARQYTLLYILPENEDLRQKHSMVFFSVLKKAMTGWNTPHPLKHRYYPVNNGLHQLIIQYAVKCIKSRHQPSFNVNVIDSMLMIFKSHLFPMQDVKSYLMLEFAKKLQESVSAGQEQSFGLKLGLHVPELIESLTQLLVPFMADILEHILNCAYDSANVIEAKINTMEGLIESNHIASKILSVMLLALQSRLARYDHLVAKFRLIEHPAVTSILNDYINRASFSDCEMNNN